MISLTGFYVFRDNKPLNESYEAENLAHNSAKNMEPSLYPISNSKESASYQTASEVNPTAQETGLEDPMNEEKAYSMAQQFCDDMTTSWLTLERIDMSDYLLDNIDTHLMLLWIDYDIADRKLNTWKQLKSIDQINIYDGTYEKLSENRIRYNTFAEISYTRYDPGVIGIGIDLTLEIESIDGKWMTISADMIGASIYREWKDANYTTMEEMDQAYEAAYQKLLSQ